MENQIVFFRGDGVNNPTKTWKMQAASTVLTSGQPAILDVTQPYVVAAPDASPVIGTHVVAGFANGISNQTSSDDGTCVLYVPDQYAVLLLPAKVPANIDTQAKYDAIEGNYVLWDLTANVYTVDESTVTSSSNGLLVVGLDVTAFPGMVAYIIRNSVTFLN